MAALWFLKLCGARTGVGRLEDKALRGHLESKGFVWVLSAPLQGELTKSPRPTHSGLISTVQEEGCPRAGEGSAGSCLQQGAACHPGK